MGIGDTVFVAWFYAFTTEIRYYKGKVTKIGTGVHRRWSTGAGIQYGDKQWAELETKDGLQSVRLEKCKPAKEVKQYLIQEATKDRDTSIQNHKDSIAEARETIKVYEDMIAVYEKSILESNDLYKSRIEKVEEL